MPKLTRTEMKTMAQDGIMHGIGNALGYDRPTEWADWSEDQQTEYRQIMQREADRAARLFGYESAWGN